MNRPTRPTPEQIERAITLGRELLTQAIERMPEEMEKLLDANDEKEEDLPESPFKQLGLLGAYDVDLYMRQDAPDVIGHLVHAVACDNCRMKIKSDHEACFVFMVDMLAGIFGLALSAVEVMENDPAVMGKVQAYMDDEREEHAQSPVQVADLTELFRQLFAQ